MTALVAHHVCSGNELFFLGVSLCSSASEAGGGLRVGSLGARQCCFPVALKSAGGVQSLGWASRLSLLGVDGWPRSPGRRQRSCLWGDLGANRVVGSLRPSLGMNFHPWTQCFPTWPLLGPGCFGQVRRLQEPCSAHLSLMRWGPVSHWWSPDT